MQLLPTAISPPCQTPAQVWTKAPSLFYCGSNCLAKHSQALAALSDTACSHLRPSTNNNNKKKNMCILRKVCLQVCLRSSCRYGLNWVCYSIFGGFRFPHVKSNTCHGEQGRFHFLGDHYIFCITRVEHLWITQYIPRISHICRHCYWDADFVYMQ